jgi:FMNH2-dependent dimethyl sulfone monooxygenase
MRLGIWCPAPQTIRPDPTNKPALDALKHHGGGIDGNYLYAVDLLRRAEELGFHISLIAQRYLGPDLDSWIFASALAAQTKTIELMPAVHPGIMDPRIAAKFGASLDRVSGGRVCINIVNGGRPQEFSIFGQWIEKSEPRYRRMHEFIQVMKGMWTQDDFNFHGEFYTVEHGTVPTKSVRSPHPPIFAASQVDEGMNVVSQECDTWFVNYDKDWRKHEENLQRIEREIGLMQQRTQALGRHMDYGINAFMFLGETDAEAQAKADDHLAQVKRDPTIGVGSSGIGAALIGSPKTVAERIRRYESLGVNLLMLAFYPMRQGLEEFAQKVLPEIARQRTASASALAPA